MTSVFFFGIKAEIIINFLKRRTKKIADTCCGRHRQQTPKSNPPHTCPNLGAARLCRRYAQHRQAKQRCNWDPDQYALRGRKQGHAEWQSSPNGKADG